jgi:hypothetical protein
MPNLMSRKLLFAILILSLIIEVGLSVGIFFFKAQVSKQFGVPVNSDTEFLSYLVGWLCLFVSLILILAIYQLTQRNGSYAALCYIMGFFWIAIGIAIFIAFGKPDNLFIDSIKGALIVGLTYWNQRMMPLGRR